MTISRDEATLEDGSMWRDEVRFGDVVVKLGHRFTKSVHITEAAIRDFATICEDRNPIHYDADFAARTRYGTVIASGPHTLALFTAMVATHFSTFTPMVGLEFSYKFLRPVKADDRLDMSWEVISLMYKASLGGTMAQLKGETTNQDGDIVLAGTGMVLLTSQL